LAFLLKMRIVPEVTGPRTCIQVMSRKGPRGLAIQFGDTASFVPVEKRILFWKLRDVVLTSPRH